MTVPEGKTKPDSTERCKLIGTGQDTSRYDLIRFPTPYFTQDLLLVCILQIIISRKSFNKQSFNEWIILIPFHELLYIFQRRRIFALTQNKVKFQSIRSQEKNTIAINVIKQTNVRGALFSSGIQHNGSPCNIIGRRIKRQRETSPAASYPSQ